MKRERNSTLICAVAALKYFNLNLEADTSRGGSAAYNFKFFGRAVFGYVSF